MRSGVPDGWEQAIAEPIARIYGRTVRLAPSSDSQAGRSMVDVFVDDEPAGALEVIWDDSTPLPAVLSELRGRIEELCAQELGSGL